MSLLLFTCYLSEHQDLLWLAELFPLTHFLRIVRGIVLREAGLGLLWQDVWPLVAFIAVFLTLATIRFRKRLD